MSTASTLHALATSAQPPTNGTHEEAPATRDRFLNNDHKRQMWERQIAQIEQNRYALVMERQLLCAVRPKAGQSPPPELMARLQEIAGMFDVIAVQHAEACASLDALTDTPQEVVQ